MSELKIENARIKSTYLGKEDHGIMTAYLHCEMAGSGCGFGGFAFDQYDGESDNRIALAYGVAFISEVLRVTGVASWESLPGTLIRVETNGWGGGMTRIGHYMNDLWFDPRALAKESK